MTIVDRRTALGAIGSVAVAATMPTPAGAQGVAAAELTLLYPHESTTRTTRDLSGLWRFKLDRDDCDDRGEADRWYDGLSDTRSIPVPCSWNDLFVPWLDRTIEGAIAQGVSWFTYWSSHDVDRRLDFHPFEYDLGLLDGDNKVKERGRAFRRLADAHRGKRVVRPTALASPPTQVGTEATWRWMLGWMA